MKILIVLLTVVFVSYSVPSLAKPCSSLAYEELKDMKAEELKREVCLAWANADESNGRAFDLVMSHRDDAAAVTALEAERDQCKNEATRIVRVLSKLEPGEVTFQNTCKAARR